MYYPQCSHIYFINALCIRPLIVDVSLRTISILTWSILITM
jgi:hypothetical protein